MAETLLQCLTSSMQPARIDSKHRAMRLRLAGHKRTSRKHG
jgi:hypothetical protein